MTHRPAAPSRLRLRLPRPTSLGLLFAALAVGSAGAAGAACSSSTTTTSTSATTTGATTGTSGAGGGGTRLCDNASDEAARVRGYCPGNQNIEELSGQCGLDCIMAVDAGGCVGDCLVKATAKALSPGCASCVADTVVCARDYCLGPCIADTQSKACLDCRCGNNVPRMHDCYADYERCAGKHLPDCDQLEAGAWDGYPQYDAGCPD